MEEKLIEKEYESKVKKVHEMLKELNLGLKIEHTVRLVPLEKPQEQVPETEEPKSE